MKVAKQLGSKQMSRKAATKSEHKKLEKKLAGKPCRALVLSRRIVGITNSWWTAVSQFEDGSTCSDCMLCPIPKKVGYRVCQNRNCRHVICNRCVNRFRLKRRGKYSYTQCNKW